jgi:hypothetical protein
VPESSLVNDKICCPYNNCNFSANISKQNLTKMSHPVTLGTSNDLSLDSEYSSNEKGSSTGYDIWQKNLKSNIVDADINIDIKENLEIELNLLKETIATQQDRQKSSNTSTSIYKQLMYDAFLNITNEYPEDMVSYLVHMRQTHESSIQARIFQEYVRLIKDALPFSINKANRKIDIASLLDPALNLFYGKSTFKSVVKNNLEIPNETIETYYCISSGKNLGRYYIGDILEIKDLDTGKSLKSKIKEYTFVNIKMSNEVKPGTNVEVTHFIIPPHYDMGAIIYLNRIRKKIVDSIYFKLNGEKR